MLDTDFAFCLLRHEHFEYETQESNTQIRYKYVSNLIWGGGARGGGREKKERGRRKRRIRIGGEGEEGRKSRRKAEEEEGEMRRSQERSIISACALLFRRINFGCEELLSGQPMWLPTPGISIRLYILCYANQIANNCFDYLVSNNYPAIDSTSHFIMPLRFNKCNFFFLQITSFVINQSK